MTRQGLDPIINHGFARIGTDEMGKRDGINGIFTARKERRECCNCRRDGKFRDGRGLDRIYKINGIFSEQELACFLPRIKHRRNTDFFARERREIARR
jgi:hypothetical protein